MIKNFRRIKKVVLNLLKFIYSLYICNAYAKIDLMRSGNKGKSRKFLSKILSIPPLKNDETGV